MEKHQRTTESYSEGVSTRLNHCAKRPGNRSVDGFAESIMSSPTLPREYSMYREIQSRVLQEDLGVTHSIKKTILY